MRTQKQTQTHGRGLSFSSRHGMVIPLVAIASIMVLVFVLVFNMTVSSQKNQDILFEQDLKAFYIADAGFRHFVAGIQLRAKNDPSIFLENWSQTTPKTPFEYREESSRGDFQVFASSWFSEGRFSHLSILSKGELSKLDPSGKITEKSIVILKGILHFHPPTPGSSNEMTVTVSRKGELKKVNLFRHLKDPEHKSWFSSASQGNWMDSLISFFEQNSLESLDFQNPQVSLADLNRLENLNEELERRKRFAKLLASEKNTELLIQIQAGKLLTDPFSSENNPFEKLPEDPLKSLGNLNHSKQALRNKFAQITPSHQNKIRALYLRPSLQGISIKTPQGIVLNGNTLGFEMLENVLSQPATSPLSFLFTKIPKDSEILLGENHLDSQKWFEKGVNNEFFPTGSSSKGVTDKTSSTQQPQTGSQNQQTTTSSTSNSETDSETVPESDPTSTNENQNSEPKEDGKNGPEEKEIADMSMQELSDYAIDKIIPGAKELPDLSEMSGTAINALDAGSGFLAAFKHQLLVETKTFIAMTKAISDRNPTKEELEEFRRKNPIPSPKYIKKIGDIIDKVYDGNQYNLVFGAHVRGAISGSETKFTEVTVDRSIFKTELIKKIQSIKYDSLPKSDSELIDFFSIATWRDSLSGQAVGTSDNRRAHENFKLVDKNNHSKKILLSDYIKQNL